jgi:glycosyltransferase involved in cell wall biosynthesis
MTGRLLYVVGQLRVGGLERQLWYLLQRLRRKPYAVSLLVWSFKPDDFYVERIRSLEVEVQGFTDELTPWQKLKAVRLLARRLRPEIVHSYSFYTNFAAWFAARGTAAIPIGSLRSDFFSEKRLAGRLLGRLSARWPRTMIANNRAASLAAEQGGFFKPGTVHVVRNGLDLALFKESNQSPAVPTIVSVGSLQPDKKWGRLVAACGELHRSGKRFRLRMIGDGPLMDTLRAQAASCGIKERVEFLGQRQDVPEMLAQSTLLAHTADREGCPNVVMEAMACGKPVVAMDAGDIPELVDHGRTGYVVRRGDQTEFVAKMSELIEKPKRCQELGRAGRIKAEREFSLERMTEEMLTAYRAAGWRS